MIGHLYPIQRVWVTLAAGLALLVPARIHAQTGRVPIYPTLAANPDLALCGPVEQIKAGPSNWGTGIDGSPHSREFITIGNGYRIRQNGTVRRIRVNLQEPAGLTGFCFRVWRKQGDTYDLVGSSENLAHAMVAGPNTLDLQHPVVAMEGDYYGYRIESTAAANFYARMGLGGRKSYYVTDTSPGLADYDWEAQSVVASGALAIEMYMQAPVLVGLGDGLMEGYPAHRSFVNDDRTRSLGTDILSYLGDQWRVTRQNLGINGATTTDIANVFSALALTLKPRIALLEGGLADLFLGGKEEIFLVNWKKMLDACQANGIKPVVLLILPWSNANDAKNQKRDSWNLALRDLAHRYPGAVVVDASTYIGVSRASGPPNNLWNIDKPYSADGAHLTPAGYQRVAQAIIDQYTEP